MERREEQARGLEGRLGEQRTRLETLLAGEIFEALQNKLALLETRITAIQEKYPDWEKKMPDSDRLQQEARAVKEQFIQEVEKAEGRWEQAQISLSESDRSIVETGGDLTRSQNLVQSLEGKLANLLKLTDEKELDSEIARTGLEFEGAKAGLQEAERNWPDMRKIPWSFWSGCKSGLRPPGKVPARP